MTSNRLKNPIGELVYTLNQYDDKILSDDKFEMLLKNLHANLYKVFSSTIFIYKIQKEKDLIKKYSPFFTSQLVEYYLIKLASTWDISFKLISKIIKIPKNKYSDKYELIENYFFLNHEEKECKKLTWYREFNKIRNSVTHGGISLKTFYDNDRIMFQAYDTNVDEIIKYNDFFNVEQRLLIFADFYCCYHTILLYNYLLDIFNSTLKKYVETKKPLLKEDYNSDLEFFKNQLQYFNFEEIDVFFELRDKMNQNYDENIKWDFYYKQ